MDASTLCDAMKVAMTEITVDGLTGAGMTWNAEGEPSKEPKAVVIENGAYKSLYNAQFKNSAKKDDTASSENMTPNA